MADSREGIKVHKVLFIVGIACMVAALPVFALTSWRILPLSILFAIGFMSLIIAANWWPD